MNNKTKTEIHAFKYEEDSKCYIALYCKNVGLDDLGLEIYKYEGAQQTRHLMARLYSQDVIIDDENTEPFISAISYCKAISARTGVASHRILHDFKIKLSLKMDKVLKVAVANIIKTADK